MLITFSGLDGAGKSTLIASLRAALEGEGCRVAVLHMYDDVGVYGYARRARNALLHLLGRRVPRPHPGRHDPAASSGSGRHVSLLRRIRTAVIWSGTLRACVYPIDLLIFALYRVYFETLTKRVLVLDRYFYDTLVDLSRTVPDGGLRLLARLTPTPDLPVLLDVPPEQAAARKGEYTLDYLQRRWGAYRRVVRWVPTCVSLPNTELQRTRAALWRVVTARMPARPRSTRRSLGDFDHLKEDQS